MPATGSCCCCCCWPFKKAASGKETPCYRRATAAAAAVPTKTQPRRFPGPERPFWNLLQKLAIYVSGCWLAVSCCTAAVALTDASACVCCCLLMPAAACCCLRLPAACCCLLLPAAVPTKTRPSRTGKRPWPWRTNGVQNRRFPGPERPFWNLLEKACYTFLDFSMLATGSCCCCCAHKDAALPDGETPWPWRTNGVQNRRFPGPERPFWNLLEKACYTFLDAGYWELLLLCPQRHGPPGRGNTMALKDKWSPKYAFPGAGTSLLKSPRKSLLYVSRCWLLGAAAAAGAADPSKRRLPARKPHATEGRQRLLLLLLCPQRHGPPGRGNTMALKDERSPKYAFPEAGTSLLKSPRQQNLSKNAILLGFQTTR